MKHLKQLGLVAIGALVLIAFLGTATASGTELYKNTGSGNLDTLGTGTEIAATLKSGTSLLLKDEFGTTTDTCTGSEVKGKFESAGGEASHPSGKLSGLSFSSCSHTMTVIAKGELEVKSAGGTNGTVYSRGAEITVFSTFFAASAVCKTGAGTALGTLTAAEPGGQATIDVNAKVNCGILGTAGWTGTYTVTNPTGLVVETKEIEPPKEGTELYKSTAPVLDTLGTGTEIAATLKSGTSLLLKDEFGTTTDTCTGSEVKGKLESAGGEASHPSGKVSSLTFSSCSHTTDVIAPGELEVKSAGGTNGTVYSKNAEIKVYSTFFGATATCKTGTGTVLGTLTGAAPEGNATIDINAKVNCGILGTSSLTGTYVVTNPTGLVVETTGAGTELYKSTGLGVLDTLGTGTEIAATLKSGTSLLLKDEFGTTTDTCTGSEVKGKLESAGGEASHPSGKVSSLTFSSCSHTTDVIVLGELEVKSIAGTTNGTVYSKNAEVTVKSTFFGASATCKTGAGTALGTLTGAEPEGQATLHINAKIPCGILGTASLTGNYAVTNPTGMVVEQT